MGDSTQIRLMAPEEMGSVVKRIAVRGKPAPRTRPSREELTKMRDLAIGGARLTDAAESCGYEASSGKVCHWLTREFGGGWRLRALEEAYG